MKRMESLYKDAKYLILRNADTGEVEARRYDVCNWRDLTGDHLIGALLSHIEELETKQ